VKPCQTSRSQTDYVIIAVPMTIEQQPSWGKVGLGWVGSGKVGLVLVCMGFG